MNKLHAKTRVLVRKKHPSHDLVWVLINRVPVHRHTTNENGLEKVRALSKKVHTVSDEK